MRLAGSAQPGEDAAMLMALADRPSHTAPVPRPAGTAARGGRAPSALLAAVDAADPAPMTGF